MAKASELSGLVFVLAALCVASCGGRSSPTEPSGCANVAGTYNAAWNNSCGGFGTGVVVVAQSGCNFSAMIPGPGGGTITGVITGNSATFTLAFGSPCTGGTATGTATLSSTAINGTFSGGALGPSCCNPVSGSFTLTR
jgi:hypothetical protein